MNNASATIIYSAVSEGEELYISNDFGEFKRFVHSLYICSKKTAIIDVFAKLTISFHNDGATFVSIVELFTDSVDSDNGINSGCNIPYISYPKVHIGQYSEELNMWHELIYKMGKHSKT